MTKETFGSARVPLSPAVRAGDFVFVSGQVPKDSNGSIVPGGIAGETVQVMKNIASALSLAGCDLSDVVKTTVWLRDRADFAAFNAAYARFFPQDPPARTTSEARLMIDISVEIEAIAFKPV